jgi:hypothetical protein
VTDEVQFFATLDDLRGWLEANDAPAAWLGFPRVRYGADRSGVVPYRAAEDELAALGWAPGERRAVDATTYAVRFAPGKVERHPTAPAWMDTPTRAPDFSAEYEERFRSDEAAWEWFQKQPPKYRRVATWWVMTGKAEETRERRIRALIASSAAGEKLAQLQRQM